MQKSILVIPTRGIKNLNDNLEGGWAIVSITANHPSNEELSCFLVILEKL